MPKCKICGTRIDIGTAVCPSCGAKVVSSSAVPDAGINANAAARTAKARVSSTTQVIKTTCAHCGAEVIGEHRFCPQCGVNLKEAAEEKKKASTAPQERRCPHCGSVVQENSRFCPDCGKTLVVSSAKATPAQQAAPVTKASSPAPATNSTGNTSKLRISLIPESLTEMTAFFDSVQDFCSSPEVQNMSGMPTLGVDGELTEDELDSIVNLVAQGREVKTFNLSSCTNALQLKNEQFFTEELFERCAGLETVLLPDGKTLTQDSTEKATKKKNTTPKKKGKGLLIAAIIAGLASLLFAVVLVYLSFFKSPLVVDNGIIIDVTNKDITTIEIPSSITAIGDGAFSNCSSLTSINIPTSVTSIGNRAFANCSSLTSIDIPSSVTSIGIRAFNECTSLERISIPSTITSIKNEAFKGCISLQSIKFPSSITSIGNLDFSECTSLKIVDIPSSVTSIGYMNFNGCTSLQDLKFPSSITSIGDLDFSECTSLKTVDIPSSVNSIGYMNFNGCTSLISITIPNSVKSISDKAFKNCSSLTSINIPTSLTSIGNEAFMNCTSLTNMRIPSSVIIGKYAFLWTPNLTISCSKGSYIEAYCKKNNVKYVTQ